MAADSPSGHVQGDLFALLAEQQTGRPEICHVLMPNMSLACGRDTLTVLQAPHHGRAITTITDRATCPDCLAVPDLPAGHPRHAAAAGMTRRDDLDQDEHDVEGVERDGFDEDQADEQSDEHDVEDADLPLACASGMSGRCGQLCRHARCYFNQPDGIAAVRAWTYGMWRGHQWVCACPCHEIHDFPPCPQADHKGGDQRQTARADHDIQPALF